MDATKRKAWQTVGAAVVWIAGGSLVLGLVALAAFFATLKIETRGGQVTVPDLTGMTREEAARAANARDFVVEVVQERNDPGVSSGRVLQQQPPPGSSVRRGRKIRLTVSLGGKVISVPDLVGKPDRTESIEIRQEGLVPGERAAIPARGAPAGTVLAQVPPAGTPAVSGVRVHRLVSEGEMAPRWVMPDLSGLSLARVERWIEESGFRKGAVRRLDSTGRAPGTVVGQLPLAGYPVRAKDALDLTVAR